MTRSMSHNQFGGKSITNGQLMFSYGVAFFLARQAGCRSLASKYDSAAFQAKGETPFLSLAWLIFLSAITLIK